MDVTVQLAFTTSPIFTPMLYEYCGDARSKKEIAAQFDDAPWVDAALEEFVDTGTLIVLSG